MLLFSKLLNEFLRAFLNEVENNFLKIFSNDNLEKYACMLIDKTYVFTMNMQL